ncbi:hypothetical protein Clacol_002455 [Clathrus columnatus]|uniref:DUF6534 domain-containing protein n=1 Tax=Clathrus columnatus TaxID=1419009 RepID=A0AAV5A5G3_9AGAM|nr:hypothetical protein Clacol_002455 [Clathrus columnatus]
MGDTLVLTMGVALIGTLVSAIPEGPLPSQNNGKFDTQFITRAPSHESEMLLRIGIFIVGVGHAPPVTHFTFHVLLPTAHILQIANFNNPKALQSAVWSFNFEVSVNFPELTWITKVGLGSAAACDLIIATGLCWYLYQSRTGYRKTDSLIVRLMVYTLNCGLLTGVCATMVIITCTVTAVLPCGLNSRQSLRGKLGYTPSTPSDLPSKFTVPSVPRMRASHNYGEATFETAYPRPPSPQPVLTVRVDTTTETSREYYKSEYHTTPQQETASFSSVQESITAVPSPSSLAPLMYNGNPRTDPWVNSKYP